MINYKDFCFKNLIVNKNKTIIKGSFVDPEMNSVCDFKYNISSQTFNIYNNKLPKKQIAPLPFWWLYKKLVIQGYLNNTECIKSY